MLDGTARRVLDPTLDKMGAYLATKGASANAVTLTAFVVGMISAALIAFGYMIPGLILLLLSRLGDGLDGAVARHTQTSDFGGFLDIVLDFAFYGAIPLAFIIYDPTNNAIAGAVLLFAFYVNGASFLAYSILAEKYRLQTAVRGEKSIYFTTGLAEATETFAAFAIFCLFPSYFAVVAYIFAAICIYTAFSRIVLAWSAFKPTE
ncbi:MAG: CDP-alcohol phosphatidyltransferase family protein [Lentilitoribacter sp.]